MTQSKKNKLSRRVTNNWPLVTELCIQHHCEPYEYYYRIMHGKPSYLTQEVSNSLLELTHDATSKRNLLASFKHADYDNTYYQAYANIRRISDNHPESKLRG